MFMKLSAKFLLSAFVFSAATPLLSAELTTSAKPAAATARSNDLKSCPSFYRDQLLKTAGKLVADTPIEINYLFKLNFTENSPPDFVTTDLSSSPRVRYFKYAGNGQFQEDKSFPLIKTEHARAILPLMLGDQPAMVIADHGLDQPPFPGAQPRLLLKQNGVWVDKTAESFPKIRNFNFNVSAFSLNQNGLHDLFFNVVDPLQRRSFVLKNDAKNNFTLADVIPEQLKALPSCFMTSKTVFSNPTESLMYLGSCDRPMSDPKLVRDRLLIAKSGRLVLLPENLIPPRLPNASWGTVDITTGDLNHDGFADVVTANHNFGFTEGGIQLYLNQRDNRTFRGPKKAFYRLTEPGITSFVPFVRVGSLEDQRYPDIVAPIIGIRHNGIFPPINKFFTYLKNTNGKDFQNISRCFDSQLKSVFAAEFFYLNDKKIPALILFSYDGQFEIYTDRRKQAL